MEKNEKIGPAEFKVIEGRARISWPSKGKYKTKFFDELTEEDFAEQDAFIRKYASKPMEEGDKDEDPKRIL